MLVEEELARETATKTGIKNNYQNEEKEDGSSSNKKAYAINRYIEYALIRTTYA